MLNEIKEIDENEAAYQMLRITGVGGWRQQTI